MADEMNGVRAEFEAFWAIERKRTWMESGCHTYRGAEPSINWAEGTKHDAWRGWQARASLAANAGREPVAWALFAENGNIRIWSQKPLQHPAMPLYTHPSPPEGMVGGWRKGVEDVAALLAKKADDFAQEHGHDDMGGLSFGRGAKADAKLDYHSGLLELADEVRQMHANAPPECRSDNPVLMEHSGCGRGTQVDTLTVRLNPGDKVILCPGPVTRASIAAPPIAAGGGKEL